MPSRHSPRPLAGLGRAPLIVLSCQVIEGPVDEIVRPRPQGSSPVYECTAEGAGFGLPVSLPDGDPQAEGKCGCGATGGRVSFVAPCGQLAPFVQPHGPALPCPAAPWATVPAVPTS